MIENVHPGDYLDLSDLIEKKGVHFKDYFLDEFSGYGYVTDSYDRVGEVSLCPSCQGGSAGHCLTCEDNGTVVDWGKGTEEPYSG